MMNMPKHFELFLFESPHNRYRPEPPPGFFALRSNKRRIFVKLKDGKYPAPLNIEQLISSGEFIESTL